MRTRSLRTSQNSKTEIAVNTIRELIRPEMARLQWANRDLARVLDVSEARIYAILRCRPDGVTPRTLGNLARALGVGVDLFFAPNPGDSGGLAGNGGEGE